MKWILLTAGILALHHTHAQQPVGAGKQADYWIPVEQIQFGVYLTSQSKLEVTPSAGDDIIEPGRPSGVCLDLAYYSELSHRLGIVARLMASSNSYRFYINQSIDYDATYDVLYFSGELDRKDAEFTSIYPFNGTATGALALSYSIELKDYSYFRFEAGPSFNYQIISPVNFGTIGTYQDNFYKIEAFTAEFENTDSRYQWGASGRIAFGVFSKPIIGHVGEAQTIKGNNSIELALTFQYAPKAIAQGEYQFYRMEESVFGELFQNGNYIGLGITYGLSTSLRLPR